MDKRERGIQLYNLLRTARLNVLYYEESLRRWTIAIRTHDVIVAVTSAASPIAYFKHSNEPIQKQFWFYCMIAAGVAGLLKPIFRLDKQIALYTELVTHYRELHHDLKCLAEDMAANRDFSLQLDKRFQACRLRENDLQKKEPVPQRGKIKRLQAVVEREYDLSEIWLPQEE